MKMIRIYVVAALLCLPSLAFAQVLGTGMNLYSATQGYSYERANDGTTGTTVNTLTQITTAGKAIIVPHTSLLNNGIIGVTTGEDPSGSTSGVTTGNAILAKIGTAPLLMDGTPTNGDLVVNSITTDGYGHDTGAATCPAAGQTIGKVVGAASGSVYYVELGSFSCGTVTSTAVVNVYDSPGTFTWTWSSNYTNVFVVVCGPGGPSGSGGTNVGTGSTTLTGGAGAPGSGGECAQQLFRASDVATNQTITVAAGGTGGASVTSATAAAGNPGVVSSPCDSSFGSLLVGHCGGAGLGGLSNGATNGATGASFTGDGVAAVSGTVNGLGGTAEGPGASSSFSRAVDGWSGGGSMGSSSSSPISGNTNLGFSRYGGNAGSVGGSIEGSISNNGLAGLPSFGATGIPAAGTSGTPTGGAGVNGTVPCEPGSSGAGGYGNFVGAGGAGGAGGRVAGAGGGGAALLNFASGAGAAGGHGCVYVSAW